MNEETLVNNSVYKISLKDYILRILILGSRNNKYNTNTNTNRKSIPNEDINYIDMKIKEGHGEEILNIVKDVYNMNRAPKLDNTLMILAMLCRSDQIILKTNSLKVLENFKTISHLYSWKKYHSIIKNPDGSNSKGFGRAIKRSINNWIISNKPEVLSYQITKYISREGWSFKNILQCTHVKTNTGDDRKIKENNKNNAPPCELDLVLRYAVNGFIEMETLCKKNNMTESYVYKYLKAVYDSKNYNISHKKKLIDSIYEYKLTREQIPTWGLVDMNVLTALLLNKEKDSIVMPLTALLRNLGNLTSHNVFDDENIVILLIKHITNISVIKNSNIHPVTVLTAWFTYRNGKGVKGCNTWNPNNMIVNSLEEMFYLSFKNVIPTGKRICFLIDCSGSMTYPSLCEGVTNAEAAALLAMIFARSELQSESAPSHSFYLFTSTDNKYRNTGLTDVSDVIDSTASLEIVLNSVQRSDWGQTDISMGILEALRYKRKYDAFIVITDNDVNSGISPSIAMKQYRDGMKMPNSKLVVVATKGCDYSVADPNDINMMDVCGFDSFGPKIIQDFIIS